MKISKVTDYAALSLPLPLMVSYVKAKHKTQELLLSTRQRNAVLVGWADF